MTTVAAYVERVRAALGDLPPKAREELLEDLPEHLAEVMASSDEPLETLVGPPEAYAAELRAAAGVETPRQHAVVRQVRDRLRAADTRFGPLLGYASMSAFGRQLRPAWWVLRGYLAALLVAVLANQGAWPDSLLPRLVGSPLIGGLVIASFVVLSIRLGRRQDRLPTAPRIAVGAATAVLAITGLWAVATADDRWEVGHYGPQTVSYYQYSDVKDVFVYDKEGRLLTDVTLVDQNGTPIRLGDVDQLCGNRRDPFRYPYCPELAPDPPRRFLVVVPSPTPLPSATG